MRHYHFTLQKSGSQIDDLGGVVLTDDCTKTPDRVHPRYDETMAFPLMSREESLCDEAAN
jgi:hypothetical protein